MQKMIFKNANIEDSQPPIDLSYSHCRFSRAKLLKCNAMRAAAGIEICQEPSSKPTFATSCPQGGSLDCCEERKYAKDRKFTLLPPLCSAY